MIRFPGLKSLCGELSLLIFRTRRLFSFGLGLAKEPEPSGLTDGKLWRAAVETAVDRFGALRADHLGCARVSEAIPSHRLGLSLRD